MLYKKKDSNNKNDKNKIFEEDIFIQTYGSKISKELNVFYNPIMKLNRDISLLVIATYFDSPIKFCDPMAATGIRELRFMKSIPTSFKKIIIGDISKKAIKDIKKNFKANKLSTKKIELIHNNAINTITKEYYDFIEIDPFGSPVSFLDIACQRIKHKGILSVTATDTAALCGTYPKTTFRKYGQKVDMTFCHEEVGLRNLIAYSIRQGAKYDKLLTPILSYSKDHYYKIFFKVEESRTKSYKELCDLKFLKYETIYQNFKILDYEEKTKNKEIIIGKTYIKSYNDKSFIEQLQKNLNLINDNKKVTKLLEELHQEIDTIGHFNPHKLEKHNKFHANIKSDKLIEELKNNNFKVSRPHNNRLGIKTDAKGEDIIKLMKKYI